MSLEVEHGAALPARSQHLVIKRLRLRSCFISAALLTCSETDSFFSFFLFLFLFLFLEE